MVSFPLLFGGSALAVLVALAVDVVKSRRATSPTDSNDRSADAVLMLCPFLVFFYPEPFAINFALLMALYAVGCSLQWGAFKLGWLNAGPLAPLAMMLGYCLLVGIGYLLFFHQGPLAAPTLVEAEASSQGLRFHSLLWSAVAYGVVIAACMVIARQSDRAVAAMLGLIVAFTVLPFFTGYYWWSLLLGVVLFLPLLQRALQTLPADARGGLAFVALYASQMALVASIAVYAFFF